MSSDDDANFELYAKQEWIGLTVDQVKSKIAELFDDTVTYEFLDQFRDTEELCYNYIEFQIKDGVVVASSWG